MTLKIIIKIKNTFSINSESKIIVAGIIETYLLKMTINLKCFLTIRKIIFFRYLFIYFDYKQAYVHYSYKQ